MKEPWGREVRRKKPDPKGHISYDSAHMTYPEETGFHKVHWLLPGLLRKRNWGASASRDGFAFRVIQIFWNQIVVLVRKPCGNIPKC